MNDDKILEIAHQFEELQVPMNDEWLRENNLSADELYGIAHKCGSILKGFCLAPEHIKMAVIASSVFDDAQQASVAVAQLERHRLEKQKSIYA